MDEGEPAAARRLGSASVAPDLCSAGLHGVLVVFAVTVVITTAGAPAPLHVAMRVSGSPTCARCPRLRVTPMDGLGLADRAFGDGPSGSGERGDYQAWLKGAAGVLVSVETFDDTQEVTLWLDIPVTHGRPSTVAEQLANGSVVSPTGAC